MSDPQVLTTRRRILIEAARLFHSKGFAATSMREIASAVGIEASSLYNHIKGKDALLEELCFKVSDAFRTQMEEVNELKVTPLEKLQAIFRYHVELAEKDYTIVTAFNDEWRHLPDTARSRFVDERKSYEEFVVRVLAEGQKCGDFNQNIDPTFTAKTMLSSVRWIYFVRNERKSWNNEEIWEQWCQLLLNGLVD